VEVEDIEVAIAQAKELLKHEPPFNRHEKDAYSKIARTAFGNVKKARADGFSFVQICAAFEKAGLLPSKSHPHSFRQAFYREGERQKKDRELTKRILDNTETEKETTLFLPANPGEKRPEGKATLGSEEKEQERIKRITGATTKTGAGGIVKNPDGSFDF